LVEIELSHLWAAGIERDRVPIQHVFHELIPQKLVAPCSEMEQQQRRGCSKADCWCCSESEKQCHCCLPLVDAAIVAEICQYRECEHYCAARSRSVNTNGEYLAASAPA